MQLCVARSGWAPVVAEGRCMSPARSRGRTHPPGGLRSWSYRSKGRSPRVWAADESRLSRVPSDLLQGVLLMRSVGFARAAEVHRHTVVDPGHFETAPPFR